MPTSCHQCSSQYNLVDLTNTRIITQCCFSARCKRLAHGCVGKSLLLLELLPQSGASTQNNIIRNASSMQARLRVRLRKQAVELQKAHNTLLAYEASFIQKLSKSKPSQMSSTHIVSILRHRIVQLEKQVTCAEPSCRPSTGVAHECAEPMVAPSRTLSPGNHGGKASLSETCVFLPTYRACLLFQTHLADGVVQHSHGAEPCTHLSTSMQVRWFYLKHV